jgi:hypothetical protein
MTKKITSCTLEPKAFTEAFTSIRELSPVPSDMRPLAILVPGIRTNAEWIDETARDAETFGIPVQIEKATEGRISGLQLLSGCGLGHIKKELTDQITSLVHKNKDRPISLICHSMGSHLICDVLRDLPIKFQFEHIIFLGSICAQKRAKDIHRYTNSFINHRGTYDLWPIVAYILRGEIYSHTGTFGFNKTAWVQDISFNNDHFTCTGRDHVVNYVLPQIMKLDIQVPLNVQHPFDFNFVWYLRSAFICSLPLTLLGYFYPLLWGTLLPVMIVIALYCLWPRKKVEAPSEEEDDEDEVVDEVVDQVIKEATD